MIRTIFLHEYMTFQDLDLPLTELARLVESRGAGNITLASLLRGVQVLLDQADRPPVDSQTGAKDVPVRSGLLDGKVRQRRSEGPESGSYGSTGGHDHLRQAFPASQLQTSRQIGKR